MIGNSYEAENENRKDQRKYQNQICGLESWKGLGRKDAELSPQVFVVSV